MKNELLRVYLNKTLDILNKLRILNSFSYLLLQNLPLLAFRQWLNTYRLLHFASLTLITSNHVYKTFHKEVFRQLGIY